MFTDRQQKHSLRGHQKSEIARLWAWPSGVNLEPNIHILQPCSATKTRRHYRPKCHTQLNLSSALLQSSTLQLSHFSGLAVQLHSSVSLAGQLHVALLRPGESVVGCMATHQQPECASTT
eukprot:5410076-Amphidinium_carterae.2